MTRGYYINLASSVERRSLMEANDVTKSFTRVEAVCPSNMPEVKFYPSVMTATEKCCFLSHMKVWELIAKGDDTHAVVCEDDVKLKDTFFMSTQQLGVHDFVHLAPVEKKIGVVEPKDLNCRSTACYVISKRLCGMLVDKFKEDNTVFIADLFSDYFPDSATILSVVSDSVSFNEQTNVSTIEKSAPKVLKSILQAKGVQLDCWLY